MQTKGESGALIRKGFWRKRHLKNTWREKNLKVVQGYCENICVTQESPQERINNKTTTLYHVRLWLLLIEKLLVFCRGHTKVCLHKIAYVYMFGGGSLGWKKTGSKKNISLKQYYHGRNQAIDCHR